MSSAKQKYYVVWVGHQPGIYNSWTDCQLQIKGFPGARYKKFNTLREATEAFEQTNGPAPKAVKQKVASAISEGSRSEIIWESIAVDAACSGNPGPMEYQGVDTETGTQLFHQKFQLGTNNIGEFLAIVHALAMLQKQNSNLPIYTDSKIAQLWVQKKQCKSKLVRNQKTAYLYQLIERAETWLKNNTYNNPVLKWNTERWGEIPADFGRK